MHAHKKTIGQCLLTSVLVCYGFLFFSPTVSFSETRYVSDTLVLNIRDNITSPYNVIDTVISEEPLIILEERDNFLFVETTDGKKGWISAQYVKTTPPKSKVIDTLHTEIDALKSKLERTEQELEGLKQDIENGVFTPEISAAKAEVEKLRQNQESLLAETNTIKKEYDDQVSSLASNLEKLQEDTDQKGATIEELTAENSRLHKYTNIYWFCAGAAVFISGIIAGKIMTRKKKRYMY